MTGSHILILPFEASTYPNPSPILPIIHRAVTSLPTTANHFTLLLISPQQEQLYLTLRSSPVSRWNDFQGFLGKLYACLATAQWSSGKVLLDVEVSFGGETEVDLTDAEISILQGYEALLPSISPRPIIIPFSESSRPAPTSLMSAPCTISSSAIGPPVVALGGTFDHLHAAHKLLLHLAFFLSSRKIIVGVMADHLLSSKVNVNLIEPLQRRISAIEAFLIRRGGRIRTKQPDQTQSSVIEIDVVEITDPFGPTAWDEDIQALVVSRETFGGGEAVNKRREEKDLPGLELFVIDVIASTLQNDDNMKTLDLSGEMDEKKLKELKMGSTGIRQWIAEHGS